MADVTIAEGATLEQAERAIIIERLARLGANKKACAASLGISRSALYAKLNRLQIPHEVEARGTKVMRFAEPALPEARPAFGGGEPA